MEKRSQPDIERVKLLFKLGAMQTAIPVSVNSIFNFLYQSLPIIMSTKVFVNDEYEHDDRWTAVDAYGVSTLHPKDASNTALDGALEHIRDSGMPDDSTYPAFGKFLALQARAVKAKRILEVGLLGGYTAIWYLLQIPDAEVTALEINPLHSKVARENTKRAGVEDRLQIFTGRATDSLNVLFQEIVNGHRPKFDFTFIDADKENNWKYFDYAVKLSNSGAPIVVDNVIRKGWIVLPEHINLAHVAGAIEVIENAGKDERVESCLMQTVSEKNYDGFLYAVVK